MLHAATSTNTGGIKNRTNLSTCKTVYVCENKTNIFFLIFNKMALYDSFCPVLYNVQQIT